MAKSQMEEIKSLQPKKVSVVVKHSYDIVLCDGRNYALFFDDEDENDSTITFSDVDGTEVYIRQEAIDAIIGCLTKMKKS